MRPPGGHAYSESRHSGAGLMRLRCDPIATGSVDVGRRDPSHKPNGGFWRSTQQERFNLFDWFAEG